MNVDFVLAHEQLQTNVNAFWGPEQAPFAYTTSKWGRESSAEMSSDSDNSYQTPPIVGSSQQELHPEGSSTREDGETLLSLRKLLSLSSIQSQPHMLPSGGPIRILKQCGRQAKGKLVKVSWTHSSRGLEETGSIDLSTRRVRSPSPLEYPLEYTSDVPKEEREGSSNYPSGFLLITLGRCLSWRYIFRIFRTFSTLAIFTFKSLLCIFRYVLCLFP